MDSSVTMNSVLEMSGDSSATITTNGSALGGLQFVVAKTGSGSVTLTDNWSNPAGGSFVHNSGALNMAGRTVSVYSYSSTSGLSRTLDITNANVTTTYSWNYTQANKSILSSGSHLVSNGFLFTDGLTYPWVDFTASGSLPSLAKGNRLPAAGIKSGRSGDRPLLL